MKVAEQKKAAKQFSEYWLGKTDDRSNERSESQPFWLSLLREVYGVERPEEFIVFESSVLLDRTSYIDGMIPKTHVLIEQKSRGKNLDAPIKQSDGTLLTPFQQAKRYSAELPYDERPRWIVTSNFDEFRIYDMNRPNDPAEIVLLKELENEFHRLQFLVDPGNEHIRKEMEISLEAGTIVGRIYEALKRQYIDPESAESQHSLNVLCVRLVFCLYADNAGIFGQYGMFGDYLKAHRDSARKALLDLFQVLDTPEEDRDPYLDDDIAVFPYVNGGLFRQSAEIPKVTPEIVDLLLADASDGFNWRDISPTIFGAIFESTLNPQTRRAGGMHYTSIENIHKVIDPLFLDHLRAELDAAKEYKTEKSRRKYLKAFVEKLSSLRFLDPACGSGNFLTETYLSLRRMENEAIRTMAHSQIGFGHVNPIRVSIEQFYGIEINDFAVTVAQTALWIAEGQMLQETEQILSMEIDYLPLTTTAHIEEGNALSLDWNKVLSAKECSFVMGNPPFVGYSYQTVAQKNDMQSVYAGLGKTARLDYVTSWFVKAVQYIQQRHCRVAFVSTNSVSQGQMASDLWTMLFENFDVKIDFAWQSFVWCSEASKNAKVHVVIIGFSTTGNPDCAIYSDTGRKPVTEISPYIISGNAQVLVKKRKTPLCKVPGLVRGNQPNEGGCLILDDDEKTEIISKEPAVSNYIRRFMMGRDFINGIRRWCLWLVGCTPREISSMPCVMQRVKAVRDVRMASNYAVKSGLADTPWLFRETRNPDNYLAIPNVSSERRRYVPMAYLRADTIPGDKLYFIENASLYVFGVLTSNVNMAWMRTIGGKLKSDYAYSKDIVYNTFPWPNPAAEQKAEIEKTARAILDARALYPDTSLADLYDETIMPPELRKAHQDNDRAVMKAYGFRENGRWLSEPETVARLMQMYADLVARGD